MSKNTQTKFFFLISLSGVMVVLSANSWTSSWLGLEINTLGFVPLLAGLPHKMSSSGAMKYLMLQVLSGNLLLMLLVFFDLGLWGPSFILMVMFLKVGAAPFHYWVLPVVRGAGQFSFLGLLTMQKIAPFYLMALGGGPSALFFILMNALIGVVGIGGSGSLKMIIFYSSLNNIAWVIMAQFLSRVLWVSFFIVYTVSLGFLFFFWGAMLQGSLKVLRVSRSKVAVLLASFFSLAGVPPLAGFTPKALMMAGMGGQPTLFFIFLGLQLASVWIFFFYLRFVLMMLVGGGGWSLAPPSTSGAYVLSMALGGFWGFQCVGGAIAWLI